MTNKMSKMFTPINKGQFTLETKEREMDFEKKRGFGVEEEYKQNRKDWVKLAKNKEVSEYPVHVDIELASICNLRCPMCYTISPEFRKKVNAKLMDWDLFKKIIDEISPDKVYSIRLSYRGESFLHPDFVKCVKYAKSKGIKEVSSLTNGIRLDEEMFIELIHAGMDWITISFDGLGETYEKIRRPAKFKEAVEKIENYSRIKKEMNVVKPIVKVQTILPAIEDNPEDFYNLFAPISDMVSSNPLIDFMESSKDLPKLENFSCPQIYQRLVIGADGTCMMCANDENGSFSVGNANNQTIHEIWHGTEMELSRSIHKRCAGAKELEPCSECYLPLETFEEKIPVGKRNVVAEKYLSGKEKVKELNTPEKWKQEVKV